MKDRLESIDLLRIIGMLLIVCLHISPILNPSNRLEYALVYSLRSIGFLGVSLFGFISGYFGVKWNSRKFLYYYFLVFFWGVFFASWDIILNSHASLTKILHFITPISGQVCWYASAYLFLLLLSKICPPKAFSNLKSKYFIILFFIVVYIGEFVGKSNGTTYLMLIEIYIMGRWFANNPNNFIESHTLAIMLIGVFLLISLFGGVSYFLPNTKLLDWLQNNHNPVLIIVAISIFYFFKNKKIVSKHHVYQRFSKYVFAIYVIHAFAKNSILDYSKYVIYNYEWFSLIMLVIATFVICSAMEYIRKFVFDKAINTITNFLLGNKK